MLLLRRQLFKVLVESSCSRTDLLGQILSWSLSGRVGHRQCPNEHLKPPIILFHEESRLAEKRILLNDQLAEEADVHRHGMENLKTMIFIRETRCSGDASISCISIITCICEPIFPRTGMGRALKVNEI